MKKTEWALGAVMVASIGLAGCQSVNSATGANKVVPDEFNVVTKAPLVVPPEYALRPPRTGESRPREVVGASGRQFVFGQDVGTEASLGEQALIVNAGAVSTNPNIRTEVDYDEAGIVRKRTAFVDRVLSFRSSDDQEDNGTPLDPNAEQQRLDELDAINAATGGGDVKIRKSGSGPRIKLPGT